LGQQGENTVSQTALTSTHVYREIHEQPEVARRLLAEERGAADALAQAIRDRRVDHVIIAARGTSDNAARYAQYLLGAANRLPVGLAAPSLFSIYDAPPHFGNALVLGISQSGKSPDIVGVIAEARRQGALTAAITNVPDSDLAQAGEHLICLHAGEEKAVAATKTYTAELLAIAMFSIALEGDHTRRLLLSGVADWAAQVLEQEERIAQAAARYRFMQQCVVLGRGYNYSTAHEWSLKLKELAYILAAPYSSADFLHGPIALVERGFPVMAVAPGGHVYHDMIDLLDRLRNQHQADLMVISNEQRALSMAQTPVRLPAGIPEWLTPLVAILPAQLFTYYLTRERGYDTESPRSIRKITQTH
jgi:glucosamine--fructose-6-phosphate aminotransferase (isomerizing)